MMYTVGGAVFGGLLAYSGIIIVEWIVDRRKK